MHLLTNCVGRRSSAEPKVASVPAEAVVEREVASFLRKMLSGLSCVPSTKLSKLIVAVAAFKKRALCCKSESQMNGGHPLQEVMWVSVWFSSPLVFSSWIGGLAFDGWTLQVGCLVLVVSIGTLRSSDATLKTIAPDLENAAPRTFAKWGLNTQCLSQVWVRRNFCWQRVESSGRERKLVFKPISRFRRAWFR